MIKVSSQNPNERENIILRLIQYTGICYFQDMYSLGF